MRKSRATTPGRQVTPKSRAAWRAWLQSHHGGAREVWCVFYKLGTSKPTLTYDDAVEEALCFGWIDGVRRSLDAERYMHRFSPRRENSRWSESNKARVERLEGAGLMTEAGRRVVEAAKCGGSWSAPDRRRAPPPGTPREFAARLRRDAKAKSFFDSLPPSERRRYESWIGLAKRPETRARRIDEAMRRLVARQRLGLK